MTTTDPPSRSARWIPATVAVLTMAFVVGACGGSDDADQADTRSVAVDDSEATTTSSAADESAGDTDDSTDEAAAAVPQDSDLDVEMRSPDGTTLTLSHIAFEGGNILVDMEFYNGSVGRIYAHSISGTWDALRLVDDAGNTYNFVAPPEVRSSVFLTIDQGETVSGTYAFLGPLIGHPEQLRVVTNVRADDIDSWSPDNNANLGVCCRYNPGFVVPIDLTWD